MKNELQQLIDDAYDLKIIKSHFFKVDQTPTEEEIEKLKELSNKGFLTATYLLGVAHFYGINVDENPYQVDYYFQKLIDDKETDKSYLFLIANYYAALGDEWKDKAMLSLSLAAAKGHPIANKMKKRMDDDPFNVPEA